MAFADRWTQLTGVGAQPSAAMRMYRLHTLTPPNGVAGAAGLATEAADLRLVTSWLEMFHAEACPQDPVQDWHALAWRRITAGQIHLWRAPGDAAGAGASWAAVSLAAVSATAAGVARVGPVYTPPALRRRGYGAAVAAAATTAALAAGAEHVVLYADLANPTSNSIYQAIGFRPDHYAEALSFTITTPKAFSG